MSWFTGGLSKFICWNICSNFAHFYALYVISEFTTSNINATFAANILCWSVISSITWKLVTLNTAISPARNVQKSSSLKANLKITFDSHNCTMWRNSSVTSAMLITLAASNLLTHVKVKHEGKSYHCSYIRDAQNSYQRGPMHRNIFENFTSWMAMNTRNIGNIVNWLRCV